MSDDNLDLTPADRKRLERVVGSVVRALAAIHTKGYISRLPVTITPLGDELLPQIGQDGFSPTEDEVVGCLAAIGGYEPSQLHDIATLVRMELTPGWRPGGGL